MTLFTPFIECPSTSKCSKIICSSEGNNYSNTGATTWPPKAEQGDKVLEQDAGRDYYGNDVVPR
jgi:hypothetical protein